MSQLFGIRYPDDKGTFATGTMMLGTHSKVDLDTSKGNTFIGIGAGNTIIAGETGTNGCVGNTFIGTGAGHNTYSDIIKPEWYSCYNTFIGRSSGVNNETGFNNTYVGSYSGKNNKEGINNIFIGTDSGFNNNGYSNIFIGAMAGYNIENSNNIMIGTDTIDLYTQNAGNLIIGNASKCDDGCDGNIILGNYSKMNSNIVNSISIGFNHNINDSNTVYLGNENIVKIKANKNITIPADQNSMYDINDNVQGLDFIKLVRPIAFKDGNGWSEGVIGQELEQVLNDNEITTFSGLNIPKDINDKYGVDYSAFIPSLIKSIQELSKEVSQLKEEMQILKSESTSQSQEENVEDTPKPKSRKRR
jgi:hypothetical protein